MTTFLTIKTLNLKNSKSGEGRVCNYVAPDPNANPDPNSDNFTPIPLDSTVSSAFFGGVASGSDLDPASLGDNADVGGLMTI